MPTTRDQIEKFFKSFSFKQVVVLFLEEYVAWIFRYIPGFEGFALRYLWMSEEGPWASSWYDLLEPEYSGWGWGLRFLGGPEWRDSSGRIAVGLEGSFGPQEAAVEQQDDERDADLSGTEVRIYVSGLF